MLLLNNDQAPLVSPTKQLWHAGDYHLDVDMFTRIWYLLLLSLHSLEHRDTYLCEEAIYCISADPTNDSVFIAASHEGKSLVKDIRTASGECDLVLI